MAGCRNNPPREHGQFRDPDLVELTRLDPTIHLDIRYATTNNFMGHALYTQPRAFLERPAAEALVRVNQKIRQRGCALLVFDSYRPWTVTKRLWETATREQKKFLSNPREGSQHNRGCAVDLSLFDLKTGREVAMPSAYDEMTDRAGIGYQGGAVEARQQRDWLIATMATEGFTVVDGEWWHFDYRDWREYRMLNTPFEEITP